MATFDRQPFSSTNPAIDALFTREFANRQAQRQEDVQAAADATARAQIAAQSELARAQMQQAASQYDYNRLFKEREFQAKEAGDKVREEQYNRLLGIQEAAYGVKPGMDKQRRAQAIIDANANASNDASRANAMFEIELNNQLAADAKKRGWFGGLGKPLDKNSTEYRALANTAFQTVRRNLLAEKAGALNNIITDPDTFRFNPVQFDEQGNVIPGAYKAPEDVRKANQFDAMGNPITPVTPSASTATPIAGGLFGPMYTRSSGLTDAEKLGAASRVISPIVTKGFSSLADLFKVGTPATTTTNAAPAAVAAEPTATVTNVPSIKRSYGSVGYMLTPDDDATLVKTLDETPADQQPRIYKQMMDYLIQSRRAVPTNAPVGGVTVTTPDYPARSGIDFYPAYLDEALGPRPFQPERYGVPFTP